MNEQGFFPVTSPLQKANPVAQPPKKNVELQKFEKICGKLWESHAEWPW